MYNHTKNPLVLVLNKFIQRPPPQIIKFGDILGHPCIIQMFYILDGSKLLYTSMVICENLKKNYLKTNTFILKKTK